MQEPRGAVAFRYANGVEVHLDLPYNGGDQPLMGGGRFIGEKGSIDIWRNSFKIDAPGITLDLPPEEEIEKWHDKRALWQAEYHMGFWLECIPTRAQPNADVEIGHRSVSVSHLANDRQGVPHGPGWPPKVKKTHGAVGRAPGAGALLGPPAAGRQGRRLQWSGFPRTVSTYAREANAT